MRKKLEKDKRRRNPCQMHDIMPPTLSPRQCPLSTRWFALPNYPFIIVKYAQLQLFLWQFLDEGLNQRSSRQKIIMRYEFCFKKKSKNIQRYIRYISGTRTRSNAPPASNVRHSTLNHYGFAVHLLQTQEPSHIPPQSLVNTLNIPMNAPMQPRSNAGHAPTGKIDGGAAPLNGMYEVCGFDPKG